ncbi:MAG: lysylphosphatidylglycerol synthase domain-containing protein, partial [Acidobacteriota bacterium]
VYPHPALLVVVLGLSVAAGAGLTLLLSPSFHQWASSRIRRRSLASVHRMIEALARYRSRPGLLALVLGMSTGVQVLRILQAYVLSEALSLGTPLLYFFCFVPPILIVTMLPISVSGLGTTNLAYVALFSQVGMDPDGAFVLSLLVLALGVLGNLPGGAIYALEGFAPAESAGPSNGNHGNLERAGLFQSER